MQALKRLGIDSFLLLLFAMVFLGVLLPARGAAADLLGQLTYWAVALLFFLHGAKLDPALVRAGLLNWRLQGLSFAATYAVYPLLGLALAAVAGPWLGAAVTLGLLFLAVLPSTVQSSIAFTSIAGGNVPGAICAASLSNFAGILLTPLLVTLLLHQEGEVSLGSVLRIGTQIFLPFLLGQLLRPRIGGVVARHARLTLLVDRGSILLIVYAAFGAGTVSGLWSTTPPGVLLGLSGVILVLLALGMAAMAAAGRLFRLPAPDRAALFYCGSTKSLASGVPIATALFSADQAGAIVLPVMIYHMTQLIVCAVLSRKPGAR
ncbi:bile acid:sodium symporter (plasmid) [Cereibacter sphaeroides]|uniref:bile acid:sodium symporter family protein n=1 Tax=Cereibacter sphaeroides TaxID=1063 RepID=UPI000F5299C3|nr:bile acid:sodium symporter family protein [Cereibacter sphaeroides]AZB57977.1 bile acid:sodium symporter [Cereibacter sphaeroides]